MKKLLFAICFLCLSSVVVAQQKYHDAAMFNVHKGKVKSIEYKDGIIKFSEDGRLIKDGSSYLEMYSKYEIVRNEDGYPIELTTDFDKTRFEYDDEKRISKRIISAGNSTVIFSYEYGWYNVTITRIESEAGQPKKNATVYDMNDFDFYGNWVQKGIKGTERTQTNVKTDYSLGNGGNQYAVLTTTSVDYKSYYEGREEEKRTILYYLNQIRIFERSDSSNEIDLYESINNPFFFGVGNFANDIEKFIKKNNVKHERKEYESGSVKIFIPNSDKVFYGHPIIDMGYEYKESKYWRKNPDYRFIIKFDNIVERDAFMEFLIADAIKNDTYERSYNSYAELNYKGSRIYLRLDSYGIEVCNCSFRFWF